MANSTSGTILGHPKGLYILFFTELWERFSFYGMRALLILYMVNHFFWDQEKASSVMGWYAFLAYATPVLGGFVADRYLGAKRAVVLGAILLSIGHFLMAFEALWIFYTALGFIVAGVGFLKPNISTQVGALYPPGDSRRDGAFTIFYMGINLGAFFGPLICGWLQQNYGYHYGFAAAGVGMLLGLVVYSIGQKTLIEFNQVPSEADGATEKAVEQPPHVVRDRVTVLLVVFAFVILFWMAFEQSANVMVLWADKYSNLRLFSMEPPPVSLEGTVAAAAAASSGWSDLEIGAGQTQSINPFFIITIAPLFAFLWVFLAKRNLQPSTPAKMVFGLFLIAAAFLVMGPAAKSENRPSSAALADLPAGLNLTEYGATRLSYDAEARLLRMNGVLTDNDRLRLLSATTHEAFAREIESLVQKSGRGKTVTQAISSPPPGLRIVGNEAPKVVVWDAANKTLTASDEIKARAKMELLAQGARPDFKQAVDKIFLESSAFRVTIWWLVLHYLIATMAELCLSPVGLSLVTKIAPAKYVGLFMGGWFMATAISEKLAHFLGGMWGNMTPTKYFMIFVIICGVGAVLMAILVRPLKRMMHGVE